MVARFLVLKTFSDSFIGVYNGNVITCNVINKELLDKNANEYVVNKYEETGNNEWKVKIIK